MFLEILHGETPWLPDALGRSFHPYQFHGIPLHGNVVAPDGEVPQNVTGTISARRRLARF
jgi:hypothetical protein